MMFGSELMFLVGVGIGVFWPVEPVTGEDMFLVGDGVVEGERRLGEIAMVLVIELEVDRRGSFDDLTVHRLSSLC
jgi:hypothetical protein